MNAPPGAYCRFLSLLCIFHRRDLRALRSSFCIPFLLRRVLPYHLLTSFLRGSSDTLPPCFRPVSSRCVSERDLALFVLSSMCHYSYLVCRLPPPLCSVLLVPCSSTALL